MTKEGEIDKRGGEWSRLSTFTDSEGLVSVSRVELGYRAPRQALPVHSIPLEVDGNKFADSQHWSREEVAEYVASLNGSYGFVVFEREIRLD